MYIVTTIDPTGDLKAWVESDQALCELISAMDWSTTVRVIVERLKKDQ